MAEVILNSFGAESAPCADMQSQKETETGTGGEKLVREKDTAWQRGHSERRL